MLFRSIDTRRELSFSLQRVEGIGNMRGETGVERHVRASELRQTRPLAEAVVELKRSGSITITGRRPAGVPMQRLHS